MEQRSLYFTAPGETAIQESRVTAAEDEVLVETTVSAVSAGTELLIYRDEAPGSLEADATIDALDGDLSYPVKYGYATVGTVTETGRSVDDDWRGRSVFAFNPHESRFAATPDSLIPVPEGLPVESMALFPSVETATSLVIDGRPRIGERVVVFGAGIVGLCTVDLLSSFPLGRLTVVEPLEQRREHARELGADRAIAPAEVRTELEFDGDPAGADLVYELSGNPAALDDALDVTGYDSRVIVGSWYGTKRADIDLGADFHRDRVSIESSQVSTLAPDSRGRFTRDRRAAVALDRLRTMDTDSLITHRIPFAEADAAYHLLDRRPEAAIQVLLTYE
ncbi:zinc-binding alcohol dehydrogenase [Halanaeroarchaeum sp. HSR-CO]|uniref:zinc-dependent alcohol dehydrogenase n=1 Tax=Halanaeroarchaeum sp. HSR-CO TaxID=2866382 RepID=UPI00217DA599